MQTPKARRQKVASACVPCRKRKVKCDGVKPICNRCQETMGKEVPCTWDHRSNVQTHSEHIQWLEDRVRQLEESRGPVSVGPATSNEFRPALEQPSMLGEQADTLIDPQAMPFLGSSAKGTVAEAIVSEDTPSIVGAGTERENDAFYGLSSAGNFMQSVKKLVEGASLSGEQSRTLHLGASIIGHFPGSNGSASEPQVPDYTLPSRRTADRLLAIYWQHMQPLYPFFNEPQFKQVYDKIWTGDLTRTNERIFLCSLFAIFAIASQLGGSTVLGERETLAAGFASQAKSLWNVLEAPSIGLVQSYLLLSLYYQSTQQAHTCWLLVGLAVRTAQSLGLHRLETSGRKKDLETREAVRRIWYGCVLMDRVMSMTYGRPPEIGPDTATIVPLPEGNTFYTSLLRLHHILHNVLFSFYRADDKSKAADGVMASYFSGSLSVYDIDKQLHVQILSLRPALSYLITGAISTGGSSKVPKVTPLFEQILGICATACVKAAQAAIQLVHDQRSPKIGEVGSLDAWWYNVLFLYSSATCLVAAGLTKSVQAGLEEDSIRRSWQTCMSILQEYGTFDASVRKLHATLSILSDAVPKQYRRHEQSSLFDLQPSQTLPTAPTGVETNSFTDGAGPDTSCLGSDWSIDQTLFYRDMFGDGNFDFNFDPDDSSWLMSVPMDTMY